MAGGIDWFRWHHGSVTDPKFQLIAKKAGVRLGDVMVVWAFVLENASANADRGVVGALDFETLDFLLGMDDGTAARIYDAMTQRGLVLDGGRIARWEARQPKRERDPGPADPGAPAPKTSTERSREHRARMAGASPDEAKQRNATPSNASNSHGTPREEESREEENASTKRSPPTPRKRGAGHRFEDFWLAWPKNERKQDKAKCLDHWKLHDLDQIADTIIDDVRTKRGTTKWQDGYIEAPLVYLRGKRWEDGVTPDDPAGAAPAITVSSNAAARTAAQIAAELARTTTKPTPEQRAALEAARNSAGKVAA